MITRLIIRVTFFRILLVKIYQYCKYAFHYEEYKKLRSFFPDVIFAGSHNKISFPENVKIGSGTYLKDVFFNGKGGITIGKGIQTGENLTIFSTEHNYKSKEMVPYPYEEIASPVVIGDYVWFGANVNITPGTIIGDGAIIAMGSVVTKNVPSCTIVAGNPAKKIGERDSDIFSKLVAENKVYDTLVQTKGNQLLF